MALTRLDFFDRSNFAALVYHALLQVAGSRSAPTFLNGLYWATLPLLAAVNGFIVVRWVALANKRGNAVAPLPIMAIFYAVVSVHFQIPVYLYLTAGLSLASLLWLAPRQSRFASGASVGLALALSAIGVYFTPASPRRGVSRDSFGASESSQPVPRPYRTTASKSTLTKGAGMHRSLS